MNIKEALTNETIRSNLEEKNPRNFTNPRLVQDKTHLK